MCDSGADPLSTKRGPNLFFKYFYFLFGPGLFNPPRVPAKVKFYSRSLAGPLTLLHPKMELLQYREPRELETLVFPHFTWFYDYSNFIAIEPGKMEKNPWFLVL